MVRPAAPSDRSPHDCAFCTCLDPRFDVVTLKTGERHSEFCCACGLPGPNDVVSGRPVVVDVPEHLEAPVPGEIFVRSGDRWRKATVADEQRMLSHYALTGEWPVWCSGGTQPPLHHLAEPRPHARFQRVWTSFPDYDVILGVESEVRPPTPAPVAVHDPEVVVAPYRGAAVSRQRYERTVRLTGIAPAPYDAVLSRKCNDEEILPELAPSFVGCLRAIFRSRGLLLPPSLCAYDGTVNEALQTAAEVEMLSLMGTGTLETRVVLEARADANLRGYETRAPTQGKARLFADLLGATRYLRTLMRGVPPYRNAGEAIGTIYGCVVYAAVTPVEEWRTSEPLVVGDDLWIDAVRVSDLARAVLEIDARRRAATPHSVPLRVIIPTKAAVMALFEDMRKETAHPFSVGPYGILPPIERPLFDHKTAPKIESEIPYDWPSRHASDKSESERLMHGSGRFQVGDSTWYVGVDPGMGGDQGKTVFMRRESNGSLVVEAIDNTPPAGWTQVEIYDRLRAIYQGFAAPSLSSENQPSLFIAKARSKTDGPSYRFSWESPAPAEPTPASTTEVNASTFAYAPGERDAYPVGQAPGEAASWAKILANALRGPQ